MASHTDLLAGGRVYLVVLNNALVAQDIAASIRDADRDARVVQSAGMGDALLALDGVAALCTAFVSAHPESLAHSPLAAAIAARGGRIVLMGDAAEQMAETDGGTARGFPVLSRPFTTAAVGALLDNT